MAVDSYVYGGGIDTIAGVDEMEQDEGVERDLSGVGRRGAVGDGWWRGVVILGAEGEAGFDIMWGGNSGQCVGVEGA